MFLVAFQQFPATVSRPFHLRRSLDGSELKAPPVDIVRHAYAEDIGPQENSSVQHRPHIEAD
jgi:hypothetical protein